MSQRASQWSDPDKNHLLSQGIFPVHHYLRDMQLMNTKKHHKILGIFLNMKLHHVMSLLKTIQWLSAAL